MEKIINRLIGDAVVDVDKYINNGSTWLIFTESKQWVIELTKDGTLWYNYAFFKNLFAYMSMDVVENQHYITKWVEDTIINPVKQTRLFRKMNSSVVEDTLKNGVKITYSGGDVCRNDSIEDTIENGVKKISIRELSESQVNRILNNGIKETKLGAPDNRDYFIEDAIQNGVKHTEYGDWLDGDERFDDIIQNGVKQTQGSIFDNPTAVKDTIQNGIRHVEIGWAQYNNVEDVMKGGVKETRAMDEWVNAESIVDKTMRDGVKSTKPGGYLGSIEMKGKIVHQFESPNQNNEVEDVIQHGVIETFDETHHRRREVVRTIRDGIKQTCAQIPSIDAVVERVVEEGIKETHDDVYHHTTRVDGVIRNGIKEVKELPDMSGELRGYGDYYRRQKDMAKPHILYVKDVIENGNKDALKKSTY